ncbi:conserved hypothetical protein [Formosa agariphila KMM 3901]|uniref:GLPGLI family protein n=2 Tax=Formosa TaxID=225842 RepID=T2KQN6_FORAG|nr:conserved hypothetical protein [Formosa agariphila KMM 3901]
MVLNYTEQLAFQSVLNANNTMSFFKFYTKNTDKTNLSEESDGLKLSVVPLDTTNYTVQFNKSTNVLYTLEKDFDGKEKYYTKEYLPEINWKLEPQTKIIADIACLSASTEFRGRTYQVWYAPSIPSNFGPWKLHGLPGLILEAKDLYNEVIFKVRQIEFVKEDVNVALNQSYDILSLEDHIERQDKGISELSKKMQSRMGKGVTLNVTDIDRIELSFDDTE